MSVWSEVIIGIALVAGTYWIIKTAYQWNRFRRSAYIELYSSYILNIKNQYLFKNPMEESRFFAKRMEQRIGNTEIPVKSIVVFPEKSELTWEGQPDAEVSVIKRKELIATIKADMEKSQTVLSDSQIDDLYYQLAKESIEMEKNM